MLKVFTFIFLLMPLIFSAAQENEDGESQVIAAEQQTETAADTAPLETTVQRETVEAVSAATFWRAAAGRGPEEQKLVFLDELPFFQRLGIALGIIAGQAFLIWLVWHIFMKINIKLENSSSDKIKPVYIRKFKLLTAKQVIEFIEFLLRFLKYIITALQLFLTLPIVFSLFAATRNLASTLFGYILNPLKNIALGVVEYIPNLFTIVIIVIVIRYVLKGVKYFADQIEKGKLKIPGFYTEWAAPTYKILQVLLWAFTVAVIYPYLPGSDSRAFQGVSVFIGIVFSIGSSTAIGNLVAGLVITYMRPFKIGDRVQIKEITGFVAEKNLMVVRLKTHKNEYVTFPNLIILGSNIINYNTSCNEDEEGLIIFAEITIGYSTPWQTVHDILINAALATEYVQKKPLPFVLQTKLDDFYACYQINCYTKDVSRVPLIYTMLYENIQNAFRESGMDMTSAHYRVITQNK